MGTAAAEAAATAATTTATTTSRASRMLQLEAEVSSLKWRLAEATDGCEGCAARAGIARGGGGGGGSTPAAVTGRVLREPRRFARGWSCWRRR